jgi:hypothetical protein
MANQPDGEQWLHRQDRYILLPVRHLVCFLPSYHGLHLFLNPFRFLVLIQKVRFHFLSA